MTIDEQRAYLKKAWKVVPLRGRSKTENIRNRRLIKRFLNEGSTLGEYLREDAWADDEAGSNKVYLVMNRTPHGALGKTVKWEIVGYFALRSGLLYVPEPERTKLEKHEELFLELLTKAHLMGGANLRFLAAQANRVYPMDQYRKLIDLWQDKKLLLEDQILTREKEAFHVSNIFPGIEITHLCKNEAYRMPEGIDIHFAPYVFWEYIVPKVQAVSDHIGAQYLYLFAAELHPQHPTKKPSVPADERHPSILPNRLLNMYANDCGFHMIEGINILKPSYDYGCFSMVQEIRDLEKNKNDFWARQI